MRLCFLAGFLIQYPTSAHLCLRCLRQYKYKHALVRHVKFECGREPQFQCKVCLRKFKRSESLKLHVATHQMHYCPKCPRKYKSKRALFRHFNYECGIEPRFSCPECLKRFTRRFTLRVHAARAILPVLVLFKKIQVQTGAGSPQKVRVRSGAAVLVPLVLQTLLAWRLFEGPLVSSTFNQCESTLNGTNGKGLVCERCQRSYQTVSSLNAHKKYICGVDPQFECRICSKKFKQKGSLKMHLAQIHLVFNEATRRTYNLSYETSDEQLQNLTEIVKFR
ncbi:hypothetical protein GE061_003719 [Apolygus lucorum]|uniref:C2H2-type domain-containing protein n=1 Tax=Apolygus lucorum TaxID=248454 RepID=A0A8S9X4R1_APOLU|nr:hypothetical protein GE061_003719 [Apolygus lucorum]